MKETKTVSMLIVPDEYGMFQVTRVCKGRYKDVPDVYYCSGYTIERLIEEIKLMQTDEKYDV